MQIRNIRGDLTDLADQSDFVVRRTLEEDGVLVISGASNITVPMNSLNYIQAREAHGVLNYTTYEFLAKEIFLAPAVGKVLFCLHSYYIMGTTKLLIPVPQFEDPVLRSYNAYVATLFGGPQDAHTEFYLTVYTARNERRDITIKGGDILVCTDKIRRTIPQTQRRTAFVSETYYYPPHTPNIAPVDKLASDYLLLANGELERDVGGNVVWKHENFIRAYQCSSPTHTS